MNEKNKISVVINTYNAEQHLEQVLEAVKGFDETWRAQTTPWTLPKSMVVALLLSSANNTIL